MKGTAAAELEAVVRSQLEHAVDDERRGLKVYESLRNLSEIIGTQYGDRVLYELIQNAHDAHLPGDHGKIAIRLVVETGQKGTLYVANGGIGFRRKDVEAIRNVGTSAKEVGEGIGNKGIGFRSIEALTDDPQIYSQPMARKSKRFDGYCFRFGDVAEIEALLVSFGGDAAIRNKVANTIPRYLVTLPLDDQPPDVVAYAQRGYATVIVLPLQTLEAVRLATEQTRALADLDVPLLLFLDRISEVRIGIDIPNEKPYRRILQRRQERLGQVTGLRGCELHQVNVGDRHRFLIVRREVEKARVLDAVRRSLSRAPQLTRWLDWKGEPVVSIAVSLNKNGITAGHLYNFLPMGEKATAPLLGYLDAPFFTDIDRRMAKLDLPLNETLMEAAAEACAAAALSIVEQGLSVPPQPVFDLIAWTGDHARTLDDAFEQMGTSLREATVIPAVAVDGRGGWSNLSEIKLWPSGRYSVLKPQDVVGRIGVRLVLTDLGKRRIERLEELAARVYKDLAPRAQHLSRWAEKFAETLIDRKARPRTWSQFYNDLRRLFDAAGANIVGLAGSKILLDRSGQLRPAGVSSSEVQSGVYIRAVATKRKRLSAGVPLPPSTLARRYRFLDERIVPSEETVQAFVNAGLLRIYDPVEALAGLKGALGQKANDNRRREALVWAFQVWRTAETRLDEVLQRADLHVLTYSGWQPAERAAFSSSWTRLGLTLENYLVEAAEVSADCERAQDHLLVPYSDWPNTPQGSKKQWIHFLEAIGIVDGLRPVSSRIHQGGATGYNWNSRLRYGNSTEGLDEDWCAEVKGVEFNHPNTSDYKIRGRAWRLPGQIEHGQLQETAKEAFCALIFDYLKVHGSAHLHFRVGRFDRYYEREWDARTLPTPLATFLRSKRWIAASTRDAVGFRRPNECWAARVRRGGPPQFIEHVPETAADIVESEELADLAFSEVIGLRDWQSKGTAVDRLVDLAAVAPELPLSDRPRFRDEYRRVWLNVVETNTQLPAEFQLAVTRRGQIETLASNLDNPPSVVVTDNGQRFEARVLWSAGRPVLEVGDTSVQKVASLLEAAGGFKSKLLDGIGVQLLVDSEAFVPSTTDPLLTSLGLGWLPEVLVIAHELRGEQLERGVLSSTLERKARAIRVRLCQRISLVAEGEEISPTEKLPCYAFEHEELPTLILTKGLSLNWRTLARALSDPISRLIDTRLRSLESLLLRLAIDLPSEELDAPSDEVLARALECDVQTVHEHRLALRTDLDRVLHLLLPVVAYYCGIELAERLRADADQAGVKIDVEKWLAANLVGSEHSPEALLEACEQAGDRAEVRRILGLDYGAFNQALLNLDEPPLSNEIELRQLYDAYLGRMQPEIIDRLRRHHYDEFRNGRELNLYVERKNLSFLAFNQEWVLTREKLEQTLVEEHVSHLLDEAIGEDVDVELPPLNRTLAANRKSVRGFAEEAIPLIRVWCRKHGMAIPALWQKEESQAIVRHVENEGLLDFEAIDSGQIPGLCGRTGCWPNGMAETLEKALLDLEHGEIEEEEKLRETERRRAEIAQRSIEFGGTSLDTGDATFSENLRLIAERWLSEDETWFERSRERVRLATFQDLRPHGGGGGGGKGKGGRKLSDAQRTAMGLASEFLAYHFLLRRHAEYTNEDCWISGNRVQFLGGGEGDDTAGYDFLVKTPQADWLYEVKSSLEDSSEFELTANELRVAGGASKDGRRRYRILYVPYVFSPDKWYVLELQNPMGERTRSQFQTIGRGSVRMRFERR